MTAKDIIDTARQRLGDVSEQRWSKARLLSIVNEGQAAICKITGIYRKEAFIALANYKARYNLPNDCMTIRRIEYDGKIIALFNRDDIDEGKSFDSAFVCLKDNIGMGYIDINPVLEDLDTDIAVIVGDTSSFEFYIPNLYGTTTDATEPFKVLDTYGVFTGIQDDYTNYSLTKYGEVTMSPSHEPLMALLDSMYGVVTAIDTNITDDKKLFGFITDSEVYNVVGKYGITTSVVPESNLLKIYYEAVPTDVVNPTSTLSIHDMWLGAMVQYVVGTALQDDNDANNIQRGELELSKFNANLTKARELSSKDFSGGTRTKLHTSFRRI